MLFLEGGTGGRSLGRKRMFQRRGRLADSQQDGLLSLVQAVKGFRAEQAQRRGPV